MSAKFLWGEMTWPEIREASEQQRVVLLPVGVIEQHGYHLPTQVDTFLADQICRLAAAEMADRAIVVPPIAHGFVPHHMDFPGTITVRAQVFIDYVVDVCKSIVSHGFTKLLIFNGHGGNTSVLDVAAKVVTLDTGGFCAFISHWELEPVKRAMAEIRESPPAGGTLHADEYETSVYLAIDEAGVQMNKAVCEYRVPDSRYFWIDMFGGGDRITSARFIEPWSSFTESGVAGDPTLATRDKGEHLVRAAVRGLVDLVSEMRERPTARPVDRHGRETSRIVGDDWRVGPW